MPDNLLDLDFDDMDDGASTQRESSTFRDELPSRQKKSKKPSYKKYTRQISALMYEVQVNWLDRIIQKNKTSGGNGDLKRANLLRALVGIAMDCDIKVSKARTEDEMKAQIVQQLRKKLN